MSLFQAVKLLTPTTSTFHHSDWWLLAVATMWLCAGSGRLPVPLPRTEVRSMVCGGGRCSSRPGHCRVDFGGVKPAGHHVQRVEGVGRGLGVVGPALALGGRRDGRRLLTPEVLAVVEPDRVTVVEALGEPLWCPDALANDIPDMLDADDEAEAKAVPEARARPPSSRPAKATPAVRVPSIRSRFVPIMASSKEDRTRPRGGSVERDSGPPVWRIGPGDQKVVK